MTESSSDLPDPRQRLPRQGRNSFIAVMVFFGVIFAAALGYQFWALLQRQQQVIGDGRTLASYRYDLTPLRVDRGLLIPVRHKDAQPALSNPDTLTMAEVRERNDTPPGDWRKFIVGSERVVGVVIDGVARAYPIRFLRWHEVVNDALSGTPIAVTYSPPSGSAVVFDRRVAGETLTFGYSGLLYNSNLVLYDRRPDAPTTPAAPAFAPRPPAGGKQASKPSGKSAGSRDQMAESLWSQLGFRAIAGPAAEAGRTLTVLPMWVGRWEQWVQRHPETTVFAGLQQYEDRYKRSPQPGYFRRGELRYPVAPLPPPGTPYRLMDRVAAYRSGNGWRFRVFPTDEIPEPVKVAPEHSHIARLSPPEDAPVATARWFAWYAFHGDGGMLR